RRSAPPRRAVSTWATDPGSWPGWDSRPRHDIGRGPPPAPARKGRGRPAGPGAFWFRKPSRPRETVTGAAREGGGGTGPDRRLTLGVRWGDASAACQLVRLVRRELARRPVA